MKTTFKIWKRSREVLKGILDSHTNDQLIKVPQGFNNNLIWNIGHLMVVNQKLIYKLSNTPIIIPESLFNQYNTGSVPDIKFDAANIDEIRKWLPITFSQSIANYQNSTFSTFKEITTSTGFHLSSIEEAFEFNNYHEALHIGMMYNLKKFI